MRRTGPSQSLNARVGFARLVMYTVSMVQRQERRIVDSEDEAWTFLAHLTLFLDSFPCASLSSERRGFEALQRPPREMRRQNPTAGCDGAARSESRRASSLRHTVIENDATRKRRDRIRAIKTSVLLIGAAATLGFCRDLSVEGVKICRCIDL